MMQLYPHEVNAIKSLWADIQSKFLGRPDLSSNLTALRDETVSRFKELGFIVEVDWLNQEMGDDGRLYSSPVIELLGRVDEESSHDHERHAFEVQSGEADGVEGSF